MTTPYYQHSHFTLADGRKLAYGMFGAENGIPLLFFHGMPGTHKMAQLAAEGAAARGYTLIAPDRPGMGGSDFQPGRALHHYPLDIHQLLHHLKIERCGIVAISGGSPYAFQCAHDLPQQIDFVASLSGWVSYGRPEVQQIPIRRFFRFYGWCLRHLTTVAKWIDKGTCHAVKNHPDKTLARLMKDVSRSDRELLAQPHYQQIVLEDLQYAFAQGWQGAACDAAIQFLLPSFALESIKKPVIILHGTDDPIAPFAFATVLEKALPNLFATRFVEGGGHFCAVTEQDWLYSQIDRLRSQ